MGSNLQPCLCGVSQRDHLHNCAKEPLKSKPRASYASLFGAGELMLWNSGVPSHVILRSRRPTPSPCAQLRAGTIQMVHFHNCVSGPKLILFFWAFLFFVCTAYLRWSYLKRLRTLHHMPPLFNASEAMHRISLFIWQKSEGEGYRSTHFFQGQNLDLCFFLRIKQFFTGSIRPKFGPGGSFSCLTFQNKIIFKK